MFWFKKKNSEKKAENADNFSRIEVEDLIDQNWTCKEIAEELGITEQQVYRIKEAKKRRDNRIKQPREQSSLDQFNEADKKRDELKAKEYDLKIKELEIKEKELENKKAELEFDDEEEDYDDMPQDMSPVDAFFVGLMRGKDKPQDKQQSHQDKPLIQLQPKVSEENINKVISSIPKQDLDKIKSKAYSKEQVMDKARSEGLPEDLAEAVYKKITEGAA